MKITFTLFKRSLIVALSLLLTFSQDVNAQVTPQYTYTNNANGGNYIPFGSGIWATYRSQFMYFPGDFPGLGTQPGFITSIYFKAYFATSGFVLNDLQVDIGNTTQTSLTAYVTGLTTGRSAQTLNVGSVNAGDWFEIPLNTPVYVDPTQPIVVDIIKTGVTSGIPVYAGGTPVNSSYTGMTHAYSSSATGTPSTRRYSYQFGFDYFAGFPCTDTPKATIDGPTKVCPNKPFKLAPSKYYADATYKYEFSSNGVSWSNFTGVPGLLGDITDSITAAKYYRLTITCDNDPKLTYTTPVHKVSIAPFYYCYCDNSVTSTGGADIGNLTVINLESFDTVINNGNAMPVYSNSKATKMYTPMHDSISWPCFYRDTTYKFRITQIHSGNSLQQTWVQAYIDYNRDGVYNPNTEKIFLERIDGTGNPAELVDVDVKIPGSSVADIGETGMRIIISDDSVKGAPCDSIIGNGEVEDYVVKICYRPCDGPTNAGTSVSTDTSMCTGYEYVITDTTYEKARSGFDRSWQISGDDLTWFNINNSFNKDTLQRVFNGQPLFYRMRLVCPPTGDTTFSDPILVNAKPGFKCYCYSKSTGGIAYDSSDIGSIKFGNINVSDGGPHLLNPKAVMPRTDYTDESFVEFYTDSTYAFYVFHTQNSIQHEDAKVTIFMDFNNNKEYDIPEERIYTGYTSIGTHTLVDSIKIPLKAITDVPTGARFIINNDIAPSSASDSACGGYTSGETEDFIVIFRKKWPTDINGIGHLTGFGVHPNPTNGSFNVKFSSATDVSDVSVKVTNVTGQVVYSNNYSNAGTEFNKQISLHTQPSGVYFVELNADGQRLIRKLIKQ